ncbi:MAG: hypothetical protein FJ042_01130 [Candidatus Cloacimonetes bacterium]|nr:hypothetical protein [Candidatus Cloacimonadota bacterium]
MKRLILIILSISILLILTSCFEDGTLRIRNRTTALAWFSVDLGPDIFLESFNNWSRSYSSDRTVRINYNGNHLFSGSINTSVNMGMMTNFDIVADGGAIRITNQTSLTVTQVYISPVTSSVWGNNQLTGTIAPAGSVLWTVAEGNWDIKVVDSNGDDFYLMNRNVPLDTTINISFSYGREWQRTDTKITSYAIDHEYRIEQK